MNGLEFFAVVGTALFFTACVVGWIFLVVTLLPVAAAVPLGVGIPLAIVIAAMWAVVR